MNAQLAYRLTCLLVAALLAALVGCDRLSATGSPDAGPSTAGERPLGAAMPEAYACASDADCPPLPCGPCTPGAVIDKGPAPSCSQNPCLDARAVCGPGGVCVVNAEAKKSPAAW